MLTRLRVRNFKLFDDIDVELGRMTVFIGPNNAGKTAALQALALWQIGLQRWVEKRGTGEVPKKRPGVTINRRDLVSLPVPAANLLWRNLRTRVGRHEEGKTRTENVRIEIVVDGPDWSCGLEFDYANPESFYCRLLRKDGGHEPVPEDARDIRVAYLPPMSGLAANETRLDPGAINVRVGEGRTAEVLRNLCYRIAEGGDNGKWQGICKRIDCLFGIRLDDPKYVPERGEVVMTYRNLGGVRLDLSASGRGQQQTMLLLAHMTANPGSVLLLDEPDAHLEILRQRQVYQLLRETAAETRSQIIAASHSEVLLNEAAGGDDVLIAFVGKPHRMAHRGSQVAKALKSIGFEHYLQAEERGWVLYLEGSTDLAVLLALARRLEHPAAKLLEAPYVHYVANQPRKAQEHFYGVREVKPDLAGVAIYDRLGSPAPKDSNLTQLTWRRREIENYLCRPEVLLDFAEAEANGLGLFATLWREEMGECIKEVKRALSTLGEPSPWGPDIKASDRFLDPLFKCFYKRIGVSGTMQKSDYYRLVKFLKPEAIDSEVKEKLDAIVAASARARPGGS